MKRELSHEYFEELKKQYEYVSVCLGFAQKKFAWLMNNGASAQVLQSAIDEMVVEKQSLEIQIFAVKDYLES